MTIKAIPDLHLNQMLLQCQLYQRRSSIRLATRASMTKAKRSAKLPGVARRRRSSARLGGWVGRWDFLFAAGGVWTSGLVNWWRKQTRSAFDSMLCKGTFWTHSSIDYPHSLLNWCCIHTHTHTQRHTNQPDHLVDCRDDGTPKFQSSS